MSAARLSFAFALLGLLLCVGGTLAMVVMLEGPYRRRAEAHDIGGAVMAGILWGVFMSVGAVVLGLGGLAQRRSRSEMWLAGAGVAGGVLGVIVGLGCGGVVTVVGLGHFFFF